MRVGGGTRVDVTANGNGVIITLASGDTGNFLGLGELADLTDALDDAEQSGKQWVGVRQRGKDFCLGRAAGPSGPETRAKLIGFVQRWQGTELITVAAADGGCVGFGVGVFALCDVSIIATSGWFQFPEILHGPAPAIVASWLYDYVPYKQALCWTMTGARFDAGDAYTAGLVSQVVDAGALDVAFEDTIGILDSLTPVALRNAKSVARAMSGAPRDPTTRRAMALKWLL